MTVVCWEKGQHALRVEDQNYSNFLFFSSTIMQLQDKIYEAFQRRYEAVAAVHEEALNLFTSQDKGKWNRT